MGSEMSVVGDLLDTQVGQTIRETKVLDVDQKAKEPQEMRSKDWVRDTSNNKYPPESTT